MSGFHHQLETESASALANDMAFTFMYGCVGVQALVEYGFLFEDLVLINTLNYMGLVLACRSFRGCWES